MAFIALLIALEKLAPWATQARNVTAAVLAGVGIAVAIVPDRVPGLDAAARARRPNDGDDGVAAAGSGVAAASADQIGALCLTRRISR
jgi:hypothetical protein